MRADFSVDNFAQRFADDLTTFHEAELRSSDLELRDAVVVKIMGLGALAYDLPISDETPLDHEEVIEKLRAALTVLEGKKRSSGVTAPGAQPRVESGRYPGEIDWPVEAPEAIPEGIHP
jgi:hypothetical protein